MTAGLAARRLGILASLAPASRSLSLLTPDTARTMKLSWTILGRSRPWRSRDLKLQRATETVPHGRRIVLGF